jgi:hypothetical protein
MNWSERESWDKMLELLKEAHTRPSNSVDKTNRLLEALVYGIGILIIREDRKKK